jgi:hypothetical protein
MVLTSNFNDILNLNLSTNYFYNTIDASSLGYSASKSIFSWSANMSASLNFSKNSALQVTSVYTGKRLTPQGELLPSFVLNTGFRQEFLHNKAAFIFTISDLFNSLRNNSVLNTAELQQTVIRRRSSSIFYAGITYTFGKQNHKKETQIKYDTQF